MCGIAGIVFSQTARSSVDRALAELHKRGPDSQCVCQGPSFTLVHTRLSIIDLSEAASQPMVSSCGRYVIVFNGEIYNYEELRQGLSGDYRFHSSSDTEVILACFSRFGTELLQYLRGMFSFAIWDKAREELFVARDRLGVKPLYYAQLDGGFAFASRPDALCELIPNARLSINRQALRYYLEAGYVPAPYSIYEGMAKLEPGHFLIAKRGELIKTRYWTMDRVQVDAQLARASEDRLLDELDSLIEESVRLRMVSDVPLGAFLSGGIDSSLVVAYMKKFSREPVRTFTIGFKDKAFDESNFASVVAAHLGSRHTCERLAVDELLALMPDFIRQYDEPFFDYSAFPVMAVSRLARRSVTVCLSGDGGDEAFGGYHYYRLLQLVQRAHRMPHKIREVFCAALQLAPGQRFRWLGQVIGISDAAAGYAFMRGVIKDAGSIMRPSLRTTTLPLSDLFMKRAAMFPKNLSYAEMGMRLDTDYTLPDDYLQKVDVGSMAFSLEARDPLLDHKLLEWAAKLPVSWKIRGGTNKYLLRKLAYRYLPREILDRPKMGFSVPMARWLRGGLRLWAESILADNDAIDALELDGKAIQLLWNSHQAGKSNSHTTLWSVIVALQFYRAKFC